jgi:hypothetical protein
VNQRFLYLAGGIVVLGAGVILFLLVLPGGAGFLDLGPSRAPTVEVAQLPPGAVPGPEKGSGGSAIDVTAPGPLPVYDAPPPPPPEGSWEAVKPSARLAAIGPAGVAVSRGLNEMKDELDVCFDEEVQSRHGQVAVTRTRDDAPIEGDGQTILMLQLESRNGTVVLVDAPVEAQGMASDGLVACAQRVLRGLEFQVPGARPGERHRVPYTLSQ